MHAKLNYVAVRYLCRACGVYQVTYPAPGPGKVPPCHHCRREGLIELARVRGFKPFYVGNTVSKPTKPSKHSNDWVRGGNRSTSKGKTGRPKKLEYALVEEK